VSLDEASLVLDVASRLFASSANPNALTVGAELELLPMIGRTHEPPLIHGGKGPSLADCIRRALPAGEWHEVMTDSGAPSWNLPDATRISFEPGGQIEISSRAYTSCSALIAFLNETADRLSTAAKREGIELLSIGIDPYNDVASVPLQLHSDRYVRMTRYFEARGDSGTRMMRQTAALQISVDHGMRPLARWQLLNALAPFVVALFANSSRYRDADTDHQSYRAHLWRTLDRSRTGIPFDGKDPPRRYAEFALNAGSLRGWADAGEFHTFRSHLDLHDAVMDDWNFHLSTLFPEVRPKEYFELRSADTIDPSDVAAPLVFITGLVYHAPSARAAIAIAGAPDEALLERAGRAGLTNPEIRSRAAKLVDLSLEGAHALGNDYITSEDRSHAAAWLERRLRQFAHRAGTAAPVDVTDHA